MADDANVPVELVKLTIDGQEVSAPKGTLLIRVAEQMGISIPRFCDHPLLAPAGACRQCLVEVEGQRKPIASCTQPVADGMVVATQLTSEVARKAQEGMIEFLLINHPLDCPMCDKGGECPLQNQAMAVGPADSRFMEAKRTYPKPLPISTQVLLDRERCVLCQRCTRFSDEIAGDKFIDLMERGSAEQIGVFTGDPDDPSDDVPFNSYFSGNTVQICPVGALTGTQYRFRARPFDLVSTPNTCEHCAAGCAQRADHRRGKVLRRLAGDDAEVNEEWNCDKGRWAFQYQVASDRLTVPLVRDPESKELREASWPYALSVAAEGLRNAMQGGGVGVLAGGRLTVEDAYAYAKFARVVLGSNDIDFRARPLSTEETDFLASSVVGRVDVTYADVEAAPSVVIVALEPEEECPILFLRLRKAFRKGRQSSLAVAPLVSNGLAKIGAKLVPTVPGDEATVLSSNDHVREALSKPGAVLLVGERLATVQGGLSAAVALADSTGAKLAWIPRRAGDRGALEAGCLPTLLPGGRPVSDAKARVELSELWGLPAGALPGSPGRDADAILAAAHSAALGGLVVAGVDPDDFADPRAAADALDSLTRWSGFLVSLEIRRSAVSRRADVVFPVAPPVEKPGTYVNWEGRPRVFGTVLKTTAMTDARVLDALAAEMGTELGAGDVATVRAELASLGQAVLDGTAAHQSPPAPTVTPTAARRPDRQGGEDRVVLASWHQLIDLGTMSEGDVYLAGTARTPLARLSKATAAELGVADGDRISVSMPERGSITLPLLISAEMADGVVWLPANSPGSKVRATLGALPGDLVYLAATGEAADNADAADAADPALAAGER